MGMIKKYGKIIIPGDVSIWPHELRVAKILAAAGHTVEFLPTRNYKTADVLVDGVEYEIKSPMTNKTDKLERVIKRALRQSPNIIYDASRIKTMTDVNLRRFLVNKARQQPQIGRLLMITKRGEIVDIKSLI